MQVLRLCGPLNPTDCRQPKKQQCVTINSLLMLHPLQQVVLLECTNIPPRLRRYRSTSASSLLRNLQIRFPWYGWKCSCVTERAVTESHRGPERDKKEASRTFLAYKHCFVAKQFNKTLFCRDTSKMGIFCRKQLKYALRPKIWLQVR